MQRFRSLKYITEAKKEQAHVGSHSKGGTMRRANNVRFTQETQMSHLTTTRPSTTVRTVPTLTI